MKYSFLRITRIATFGLCVSLSACIEKDEEVPDTTGGGGAGGNTTVGSVNFDGTNEYFTLSSAWYTGDFSICLWMKPRIVSSSGHTLLSMSTADKYFFLSFDSDEVDFSWEDGSDNDITINGTAAITAGNTYQVCVTGDHNSITTPSSRIFINGASVATSNISTVGVAAAFTTMVLGYEPNPSFQVASGNKVGNFNGTLDNVMIWNTALPANAITQLYNAGQGFDPTFAFSNYTIGHRTALQHWFRMGDESGDTLAPGSAVINDVEGNENLVPLNFEASDFSTNFW